MSLCKRRRKTEEEGLFIANAMDEVHAERDGATAA
jgi:hypothetical protein